MLHRLRHKYFVIVYHWVFLNICVEIGLLRVFLLPEVRFNLLLWGAHVWWVLNFLVLFQINIRICLLLVNDFIHFECFRVILATLLTFLTEEATCVRFILKFSTNLAYNLLFTLIIFRSKSRWFWLRFQYLFAIIQIWLFRYDIRANCARKTCFV